MRPLTLHDVLLATDMSENNLAALRTGMELARLAGADLCVVHAAETGADRTQALEEHVRAADPASDVLPEMINRIGRADRVIAEVARQLDADVIVLGPHRPERSQSPQGTAYRVAATAERPCLVLPSAMRLPLGRVLAPIDASSAARGALAVALTWASALRRRTPRGSPDRTTLAVQYVETPSADANAARVAMDGAFAAIGEDVVNAAGVALERITDAHADEATAILERAAADGVDLIVLGTRAENGSRAELGSVSAAVVRAARYPVLLVPPRVWQQQGGDSPHT